MEITKITSVELRHEVLKNIIINYNKIYNKEIWRTKKHYSN